MFSMEFFISKLYNLGLVYFFQGQTKQNKTLRASLEGSTDRKGFLGLGGIGCAKERFSYALE